MEEEYFTRQFVECVKKPDAERTDQDIDYICHILKGLIEFSGYDSNSLRSVSRRLVHEVHETDSILYRVGEVCSCWYYVLSGSVMISNNYYYPSGSSFGQCIISNIRDDQCNVLEPTELLRIDYTEDELRRAVKLATMSHMSATSSQEPTPPTHYRQTSTPSKVTTGGKFGEPILPLLQPPPPGHRGVKKMLSIGDRAEGVDLDLLDPMVTDDRHARSRSEERYFTFDSADVMKSASQDNLQKTMEGPTSSEVGVLRRRHTRDFDKRQRFSAPPGPERGGVRDSVGSMDYLSESQMDSDDEESAQSETSSSPSMDVVLEVLSKSPSERTEEDIDRVMDILQYIPVFSNMTSNIRKALFKSLLVQTIENENTVVIDNGEEVARWYVVLNGQLKLIREREGDRMFAVGDSFGVSQSLKILPHRGRLVTASKDCTLCYVPSEEYGRILVQGEENLKREEEDGRVVAVLEKRAINAHREGYFILQATPERLINHLLVESVDDSFHKDFLLTYRTFLTNPQPILDKLREAWLSAMPDLRDRITVIMLNWVSAHFPDFEGHENMTSFLEWFEAMLLEDGKVAEKRALDRARSVHARVRYIEMDRAGTNSPLDFEVVGGSEYGSEIFVASVKSDSMPEKAGLLVGDQIMEINDVRCARKELREVQSILKKNFKLSLKVRSNLPDFKQFMADPPKPKPIDVLSKPPHLPHLSMARTKSDSHPDHIRSRSFSHSSPYRISATPPSPKAKKKHTPKIFKPLSTVGKNQLQKLKKLRTKNTTSSVSLDGMDSSGPVKAKPMIHARKLSTENLAEGKDKPAGPVRASSLEDIHTFTTQTPSLTSGHKIVDAVVKLYVPDHSYKYLDISPTTTIAELIARGVKEFYPDKFVVSPPDEYCVCMVTVQSRNGPIRNSVLPNHMTDLANFIGLESRYYLKERAYHGTLVQDEEAEQIFRESKQWENILNLVPKQVAEDLTRVDSEIFCSIDSSEYIADLWRNPDHLTKENLEKFEGIPNDEMYWVVTTIVSETKAEMRAKLIKHYIKIAKWCKELKNYNSMFHILSGLNHGLVQRLRSTWERVPHKYKRIMEELINYMNPFHNMAKYRELQRATQPPFIPLFPIIKKDLTFLFDGNETQVDGLVNFEKLRMLSQQIRNVRKYCENPMMPEPPEVDLGQLGVLKSIHHSIRLRSRHPAALATLTENALKKVYYHHRMTKMVRKHLSKKHVIQEEDLLEKIADSTDRMVQLRKNPPSPLNRGRRISGTKEKYRSPIGPSISPSPTTGSFGSDTVSDNNPHTPPLSPRRLSASSLPTVAQQSVPSIAPQSPESLNSYGNTNGSAQCPK